MPLQSRKYYYPESANNLPPPTPPDFDFTVRAMTKENALFTAIYSAAAYSLDQFTALMKLRQPRTWAQFEVNTPIHGVVYATLEAAGYVTFTFGPTDNKNDLALQIVMSATRKFAQWGIPVSVLQATLVNNLWTAGLVGWVNNNNVNVPALFTGHSLGGACAYLFSRRSPPRTVYKNFISTVAALKVSNGVEKDFVRSLDVHLVIPTDPVPDFPPGEFVSINPDYTPLNGLSPLEMSKFKSNKTRWNIDGNGNLTEPDVIDLPVGIDGAWGTISTAGKLSDFADHSIATYLKRCRAPGGLAQFDSMLKAIGA
jgi:hypothetical protein